jgi:hypothetical protein
MFHTERRFLMWEKIKVAASVVFEHAVDAVEDHPKAALIALIAASALAALHLVR